MATAGKPLDSASRPGYERVAAKIADYIATAGLQAGDRLPTERALGEQLGVSRTVVREAVKVLTTAGLVRARQGSGLYVAADPHPFATVSIDLSMPVDPEHMRSLFEYRIILETQTVRLAAQRITLRELRGLEEIEAVHRRSAEAEQLDLFGQADVAFHQGIADAAKNPFLASSVGSVHRLQGWAIAIATGVVGSLRVAAEQHAAILASIRDGRPEEADAAMRAHIQTVETAYQQEVRRRLVGKDAS